jgi:hypothetical protein
MNPEEIARHIDGDDEGIIIESINQERLIDALGNAGYKQFDVFGGLIDPMTPTGKAPDEKYRDLDLVVVKMTPTPAGSYHTKMIGQFFDQDNDDIIRIINNVERLVGDEDVDADLDDIDEFLDDAFFYLNASKKIGNDIYAVALMSLDDPTLFPPEEEEDDSPSADELASMFGM